ncbi:precorrin-3B C(17)-methyltransferase [Bradyrhizobium sp. SZCCHNRI1009]|uniref:precorrin-3B C(17)-methyltransferase n=1 Tax=Bradyrhizobium sp. SZCCHNRI1009 TaxID=3057277 RepID=UPI002915CFC9|nr:precorrin-3B C(17)-methyltransferase [Bradyrhizobium sp. SZCCHNRI1009]
MTGMLTIVGVGPGRAELITPAAAAAIASATDLIGYGPYLDRVTSTSPGQIRHASDNRVELDRARHALALARDGKQVVVVSGGDPGVFAMAAAVFEAVEAGPPAWRDLDIRVEPGVTAMLAAAAEVGAPLGGDFCAISLSDNLKSWTTIRRRLEAAAAADFVIALYNPLSKARPHQLGEAFALLRQIKPASTVVVMVRAAGSGDVGRIITTLGEVDPGKADMRTLVLIGSTATRLIAREGKSPFVYTLRREVEGGA